MCETNAKLNGKVVVVTGGSAGIGYEAAKSLAYRGAKVIIGSRNETRLNHARDKIIAETGNQNVSYKTLDLGSLKSVRIFADAVNKENTVDVLINNAGAVALPDTLTQDDLNLTMQVNFFGAFLLTFLLLPKLKVSAPSRIINGVAGTMYIGNIDFDHFNDIGRYGTVTSLANSKLAVALFSAELKHRLKDTGVTVNTFDPLIVKDTNILMNIPRVLQRVSRSFLDIIGRRKEEVGKEVDYLASAPEMIAVSGKNYKFCREFLSHWLVRDKQTAKRLWNESKELVKITKEEDWENKNLEKM